MTGCYEKPQSDFPRYRMTKSTGSPSLPSTKLLKKVLNSSWYKIALMFKVNCILCSKESTTTDKETASMGRWLCWDCADKIKKNKYKAAVKKLLN